MLVNFASEGPSYPLLGSPLVAPPGCDGHFLSSPHGGSRASDASQPIGAKARPVNSTCRKHSHEPFCPQCRHPPLGGSRHALRWPLLFASDYECANDQSVNLTRGHCNLSDFGFCR